MLRPSTFRAFGLDPADAPQCRLHGPLGLTSFLVLNSSTMARQLDASSAADDVDGICLIADAPTDGRDGGRNVVWHFILRDGELQRKNIPNERPLNLANCHGAPTPTVHSIKRGDE